MEDLSLLAAFAGGLLSFLSPCVLPVVSSFLLFLGGTGTPPGNGGKSVLAASGAADPGENPVSAVKAETGVSKAALSLVPRTLCFISGFSLVFILLSLLFSGFFFMLGGINRIINAAAGLVVIIFGLNILFDFIPFLNYERRLHIKSRPPGLAGSFAVGLAFGAGWTPCVGPILGSILLLAGQSGGMARSALYLAFYSTGLGMPFLAAALFWGSFLKHIGTLKSRLPAIKTISGVFLILIGVFIMTGRFRLLPAFFLKTGYALSLWAEGGGAAVRLIPGLIFLLAAALPFVYRGLKKKSCFSPAAAAFAGLFLCLAILQAAGLINCAVLLSRWFLYTG
jgi:cytochrome c-type biogenesis protein